ncbi:MAG: PAS domain S-box protein [Nitrospinae bacterium]|nr:PAS domain S-box protein [Nitrospinota bacterium]MBF0634144.1 PAS domain S-box protein [Nitrospinota bacterium]
MMDDIKTLRENLDSEIKRNEAILSCLKEGILAMDSSGVVLKLNQKAREMLGLKSAKAEGLPVSLICGQNELADFVKEGLVARDSFEKEIKLDGPNEGFALASRSPMSGSSGEHIGMVVALNDITQLRRLANFRRDFASNVSHELRTPITSIRGFAETLLGGAIEEPSTARHFVEIINKHANRLSSIIEDILTLSSLEQGEAIELMAQPVRNVIAKAIDGLSGKAAEKKIGVHLECAQSIEAPINGPLLESAISNLVDNAINYSDENTAINVSAFVEGDVVLITVRDQGYGMERQHSDRIFERFYRVDKARSRKAGGTGLGLSIVKHVVLAHHGKVTVESEPGKGSVFTITLPASDNR